MPALSNHLNKRKRDMYVENDDSIHLSSKKTIHPIESPLSYDEGENSSFFLQVRSNKHHHPICLRNSLTELNNLGVSIYKLIIEQKDTLWLDFVMEVYKETLCCIKSPNDAATLCRVAQVIDIFKNQFHHSKILSDHQVGLARYPDHGFIEVASAMTEQTIRNGMYRLAEVQGSRFDFHHGFIDSNDDCSTFNSTSVADVTSSLFFLQAVPWPCEDEISDWTDSELIAIILYNMSLVELQSGKVNSVNRTLQLLKTAKTTIALSTRVSLRALDLAIRNNIGQIYFQNGMHKESMSTFQEALLLGRQLLKRDNEFSFANVKRNNQVAIQIPQVFPNCMESTRSLNRQVHLCLGKILDNMTRVSLCDDNVDEAIRLCQDSLDVRKRALGNENLEVAATFYNISLIHHQMGKIPEAVDNMKQFVRIANDHMKDEFSGIIFSAMIDIILFECQRGNYDDEVEIFYKALLCQLEVVGWDNPILLNMLENAGTFHSERNENDEAFRCFEEKLRLEGIASGKR